MITLKEINTAIITQVKIGLTGTSYSSVDFSSTDIREKITRPSFYVEFTDNKSSRLNMNNKENTKSVKIYYFPSDKDKNKIELLEMQDYLSNIFLYFLKIDEENYIEIQELSFDVVDGVLTCEFDLYFVEDVSEEIFANTPQNRESDNIESIENLDINMKG